MEIENYILPNKEVDLLKLIGRTGFYCDAYEANFKLSEETLNSCVDKGLIYERGKAFILTKYSKVYSLTERGIEFVKRRFAISPYRSRLIQIEHDFVLGNIYLKLSQIEKETWITETDLQILYPRIPVLDGFYIDKDKKKVGVEVITKTYTETNIEDKHRFIERYCDKCTIVDI